MPSVSSLASLLLLWSLDLLTIGQNGQLVSGQPTASHDTRRNEVFDVRLLYQRFEKLDVKINRLLDMEGLDDQQGPTVSRRLRGCPDGFIHYPAVNNSCYKIMTSPMNWVDAQLSCQRLHKNAHIVIINDANEQALIAGIRSSNQALSTNFWLGGQRIDPSFKSPFVWKSLSTDREGNLRERIAEMTYVDWDQGEPGFHPSNVPESCAYIPHNYNRWHDVNCLVASCFLCEVEITAR